MPGRHLQRSLRRLSALTILGLLVLAAPAAAQWPPALPGYGIDRDRISVSGVSSGGYMAQQLHVAHSADIMGAGLVAAGPYYCARGDVGTALFTCSDFVRAGFTFRGPPDIAPSLAETALQAELGRIDDPANLAGDRVYLFAGALDRTVPPPVVAVLQDYYAQYIGAEDIVFRADVPAEHAMITENYGNACPVYDPPYINDCDFDLAGAMLRHIHGGDFEAARPMGEPGGEIRPFSQAEFVAGEPEAHSLDLVGHIYVPEACAGGEVQCGLHIALHGCRQNDDNIGDRFFTLTGYNEWADAYDLIVLYPQVMRSRARPYNPAGCWDWWGYDGPDYHLQSGTQLSAIWAMAQRLAEPHEHAEAAGGER